MCYTLLHTKQSGKEENLSVKNFKRSITTAALIVAVFTSSIPSAFAEEHSSELPPLDLGIGFSHLMMQIVRGMQTLFGFCG